MSSSPKLRWGILGPGSIAKKFALALGQSRTGMLAAVGSRSKERADAFLKEFGGERAYGDCDALLADPDVDAVYIATPHPSHACWAVRAARAGKHILCEKPITLNAPEAEAIQLEARRAGVFLMEAFMYRAHPQTKKIVELVRDGTLGEIRMIEGAFCFDQGSNSEGRHQSNALGGGGILDLGCYPMSMARLVAGARSGNPFENPETIKAVGHLDEVTGVDTWTSALLRFSGSLVAVLSCGVRVSGDNHVKIRGSKGTLIVLSPWFCSGEMHFQAAGSKEVEKLNVGIAESLYLPEIELVTSTVAEGRQEADCMNWADTLGNMRCLDAWRAEIGFQYEAEKPGAGWPTIDRLPLKVSKPSRMQYGELPGVRKKISRFLMGTAIPGLTPDRMIRFDEFFRLGGNAFDTAWIYSGGGRTISESCLGEWMTSRGVREEVVLLVKGAHTPLCDPEHLVSQLGESLERLQTDYADLYLMHRDNLEFPAGVFVETINQEIQSGRIHAYGFSNWSLERFMEARDYAREHQLVEPVCLSNQLSLARMVEPLWEDCISVGDQTSREWLANKQIPNFAWSSQARGFFSFRSDSEKADDPLLSRCFFADDNFERKRRVELLSKHRGIPIVQLAGAWVFHQKFPTFALFGPRNLSELTENVESLAIELSTEEVAWLSLESEENPTGI